MMSTLFPVYKGVELPGDQINILTATVNAINIGIRQVSWGLLTILVPSYAVSFLGQRSLARAAGLCQPQMLVIGCRYGLVTVWCNQDKTGMHKTKLAWCMLILMQLL